MDITTRKWRQGGSVALGWDRIVKRRWSGIAYSFFAYGSDYRRWYSEVRDLDVDLAGLEVLDMPCGGGGLFRWVSGADTARYVAGDVSPIMVERAIATADEFPIANLTVGEIDVMAMSFVDEFDLCMTYMGLHCMPDPAGALQRMVVALKPDGVLRGNSVVSTGGLPDRLVSLYQRNGIFGPQFTTEQLSAWLSDAGLTEVDVRRSGAIAYFSARKPGIS